MNHLGFKVLLIEPTWDLVIGFSLSFSVSRFSACFRCKSANNSLLVSGEMAASAQEPVLLCLVRLTPSVVSMAVPGSLSVSIKSSIAIKSLPTPASHNIQRGEIFLTQLTSPVFPLQSAGGSERTDCLKCSAISATMPLSGPGLAVELMSVVQQQGGRTGQEEVKW